MIAVETIQWECFHTLPNSVTQFADQGLDWVWACDSISAQRKFLQRMRTRGLQEKEKRKVELRNPWLWNFICKIRLIDVESVLLSTWFLTWMQKLSFISVSCLSWRICPSLLTHQTACAQVWRAALHSTKYHLSRLLACAGFKRGISLLSSYVSTWHHVSAFLSWLTWQVFEEKSPRPRGGCLTASLSCTQLKTFLFLLYFFKWQIAWQSSFLSYKLHYSNYPKGNMV